MQGEGCAPRGRRGPEGAQQRLRRGRIGAGLATATRQTASRHRAKSSSPPPPGPGRTARNPSKRAPPTTSAPAARAASAAAPSANTATRTGLPALCGSTAAPRTIWSPLRGSTWGGEVTGDGWGVDGWGWVGGGGVGVGRGGGGPAGRPARGHPQRGTATHARGLLPATKGRAGRAPRLLRLPGHGRRGGTAPRPLPPRSPCGLAERAAQSTCAAEASQQPPPMPAPGQMMTDPNL